LLPSYTQPVSNLSQVSRFRGRKIVTVQPQYGTYLGKVQRRLKTPEIPQYFRDPLVDILRSALAE
jgi:hypothetical protein